VPDNFTTDSIGLPIIGKSWNVPVSMTAQQNLLNVRIGTRYPDPPPGADVLFFCEADQGGTYYCKGDKDGRPIRATEWLFTHLAQHLNLVTPEAAIMEDGDTGETFFGSLHANSVAADWALQSFLDSPQKNELDQPSSWPGAYLSGLYAFDLFSGNWDRSRRNFILQKEGFSSRLCAFDFASASLQNLSTTKFPVATDPTVGIGRFLRHRHGFFVRSAIEMINLIAAVPAETIAGILGPMPDDWMGVEQRKNVCELWSAGRIERRIAALRSGITDGSLL
jgi:hypothetical protein